jgi:flagellin-like hook-associated protein FlgL
VYQEIAYSRAAAISSANATANKIAAGSATFTVTPSMASKPATITVMAGGNKLTAGTSYTANYSSGQLTIKLLKAQTKPIDVSFTYDKQLKSGTDYTRTTGTSKTAAQITLTHGSSGNIDIKVAYQITNTVGTANYTISSGGTKTAGSLTFSKALTGQVQVNYSVNRTLWGNDAAIQTDTNNLNNAITKLRTQAATMAANLSVITTRQDWSAGMISNLQTGSDNLTLADMNEEGANMLALQTRQQLGIQALSLASQANQSIMRLFG